MNPTDIHPTGPSFLRLYAQSTLVFALFFTLGIWLPMLFLANDGATGIGVGVFCAFWGAPGFGIMAAGARWWSANEHHQIGATRGSVSIGSNAVPDLRDEYLALGGAPELSAA